MTQSRSAMKPETMRSSYSLTGKWDDHVEFEFVSYYAEEYDLRPDPGTERCECVDGKFRAIPGTERLKGDKRYAYLLPDGRWLCGVRPFEREDDRAPLREPRWLDAPDFTKVEVGPDHLGDVDGGNRRIGHLYRGWDGHLYRVVDMFYFGSSLGWDAVVEVVETNPDSEYLPKFKAISSRAIGRTFHHCRKCPCVAHRDHAYGAK